MPVFLQVANLGSKFPEVSWTEIASRIRVSTYAVTSIEQPLLKELVSDINKLVTSLPKTKVCQINPAGFTLCFEQSLGNSCFTSNDLTEDQIYVLADWASKFVSLCPSERETGSKECRIVHSGVSKGNPQIVQDVILNNPSKVCELITLGVDVDTTDIKGRSLLSIASERGFEEIVKLLISRGGNLNFQDLCGETALMLTCKQGHLNIAEILISAGADVNLLDIRGQNALFHAARSQKCSLMRLLVTAGVILSRQDNEGNRFLDYIEDEECFEWALSLDKKLISNGKSLLKAAMFGKREIVKLIIEKGVDVNFRLLDGNSALHLAMPNNEILRFLLEHGADPNIVNWAGKTPLMEAVEQQDAVLVRMLCDNGANIRIQDKDGWSALMYACRFESKEIVKMLLEYGASVNCEDFFGFTPLMIAAWNAHHDSVILLLENQADVLRRVRKGVKKGYSATDFAREDSTVSILETSESLHKY